MNNLTPARIKMLQWVAKDTGDTLNTYIAYERSNWSVAYWLQRNHYIMLCGPWDEIRPLLMVNGVKAIEELAGR